VASYRLHSHVLALTRVQGLFEEDPPYCFLYPELGHADNLLPLPAAVTATSMASVAEPAQHWVGELPRIQGSFLEEAMVLLPASRVRQLEAQARGKQKGKTHDDDDDDDDDAEEDNDDDNGASQSGGDCLKEKKRRWYELNSFLKREIEESFPVPRWIPARNLTRELLRCKELCVTPDHRMVFVKARPKWRFSIIDFLNLATRKAGPAEQESDKVRAYLPLVNILLKNQVPETYLVNRLLLSAAQGQRSRRGPRAHHRRRHGRHPSQTLKPWRRGTRRSHLSWSAGQQPLRQPQQQPPFRRGPPWLSHAAAAAEAAAPGPWSGYDVGRGRGARSFGYPRDYYGGYGGYPGAPADLYHV
jgi:hypothetical protein